MSEYRIAKVQATFEKARNGKGLFGVDDLNIRSEVIQTTRNYFAPLVWLWRLVWRC